jgi:hypothetical protein
MKLVFIVFAFFGALGGAVGLAACSDATEASSELPPLELGPVSTAPEEPYSCGPLKTDGWNADAATLPPTPLAQNKCTLEELGDYFDVCARASASRECESFARNHPTCLGCVRGPVGVDAGAAGPILSRSDSFQSLINIGGCMTLRGATPACSRSVTQWMDCQLHACEMCMTDEMETCRASADTGACKAFAEAARCATEAPDSGATYSNKAWWRCTQGESSRDNFITVSRAFCGDGQ